jgi:DNA-binding transcriptional regulator GbsR (MarR family)
VKRTAHPAKWQLEFIDRVGSLADMTGLPPSFIRVFAWMIVCDPPHQSAEQLRTTLGLSGGAISMATASLMRMGFIERVTLHGDRRAYYRFQRTGWERMLRLRVEGATQMRMIAEDAIAAVVDPPDRLTEMRALYAWFEDVMAELMVGEPWLS